VIEDPAPVKQSILIFYHQSKHSKTLILEHIGFWNIIKLHCKWEIDKKKTISCSSKIGF
jgi:hypothetical protein